ncbi:MAG: twin-arginine translocase TatA/TatE family subunit [Tissierella sp.]|nr:twin-arginine translocase TatA/TatE family subunit [Tissierella sp.]
MFGIHKIGIGELILILAIVLVIFGPSKLPELGKTMGQTIKSFRTGMNKKDNDTGI